MADCKECQKNVTGDEIGLNMKLIDRTLTEFLCISCMSKMFSCDESLLRERIKYYKEIGCKLFPSDSPND